MSFVYFGLLVTGGFDSPRAVAAAAAAAAVAVLSLSGPESGGECRDRQKGCYQSTAAARNCSFLLDLCGRAGYGVQIF